MTHSFPTRRSSDLDFGAPQSRERLIIIGSRDEESFDWPDPTYAKETNSEAVFDLFESRPSSLLPWKTMREAIFADGHTSYGKLDDRAVRSEEHTSELQSLMRISSAVFCLKKKHNNYTTT